MGIQQAALDAVQRLFEAEAQTDSDRRGSRAGRVIVAGPQRVDIPAHVSEPVAQLALNKLFTAFGSAYVEVDGAMPFGEPRAASHADQAPRSEGRGAVLEILRARRAAQV